MEAWGIIDGAADAYRPAHHLLHGGPDRLLLARSRAMRFEMRPRKTDKSQSARG